MHRSCRGFGRGYILDKVEKVAIDYQKQMIQDMKDEEELEARKEQFEKVQNQSHVHTLRFLEVLKIYMNGKIKIQSTMEKLKTATKNKQSDQCGNNGRHFGATSSRYPWNTADIIEIQ